MTALVPQVQIQIQNDSGQVIPPRSIVVVTSVELVQTGPGQETIAIHHVTQYNCGVSGNVFVTGLVNIPAVGRDTSQFPGSRAIGWAYADQFLYVAIDETVFPPAAWEEWGPADGSWTVTRGGVGFFAQGYSATGADPDRSMFLRTFNRADPNDCSSSTSVSAMSHSDSSSSSSARGSVSGSSSTSSPCNCVTVVSDVRCSAGGLAVTYTQVGGCCGEFSS